VFHLHGVESRLLCYPALCLPSLSFSCFLSA
jgi:hypothetical protein